MPDSPEESYDILKDVEKSLKETEADIVYNVHLHREFVGILHTVLTIINIDEKEAAEDQPDALNDQKYAPLISQKIDETLTTNPDEAESLPLDLTIGEMDYINGLIEESASMMRGSVEEVDPTLPPDIQAERIEWKKEEQPEAFSSMLGKLREVNTAFMASGAPPRPTYLKYFESK